jgi:hypothetical protein
MNTPVVFWLNLKDNDERSLHFPQGGFRSQLDIFFVAATRPWLDDAACVDEIGMDIRGVGEASSDGKFAKKPKKMGVVSVRPIKILASRAYRTDRSRYWILWQSLSSSNSFLVNTH